MTGIEKNNYAKPENFGLNQIYPNPFNPVTRIEYSLANSGEVVLGIYDVLGIMVAKLVNEYQKSGRYTIEFYAAELPSGIYSARLQQESYFNSTKMVLIK